MTTTGALNGLPAALADIVFWTVFTLQQCTDEDIDLQISAQLQGVIASTLQGLSVDDRLALLEHAGARAESSNVPDYQQFLIGLAETFGLE
jgi:hypothetical protein